MPGVWVEKEERTTMTFESIGREIDDIQPRDSVRSRSEEQELVRRARRDAEAFGVLYRAHVRPISDYVFRRTGDLHVSQDLVADVFLRALRAFPRFESTGVPLRHWLFRIATNRVRSWSLRRRIAVSLHLVEEPACSISEQAPEERALRALRTLPERYQAALTLHYVEGLSVCAAAGVLGCREGTVKSRLARGRGLLRDALQGKEKEHEEHEQE